MPAEQRGSAYRTAAGWGIRWYELDGRRGFRSGFATKSEARRYFDEQVRPRLLGRAPDLTLAELVDAYLDAHAVGREPRTIRTLRERLKYATDAFGDLKLTELERNPRQIATWMRTLPVRSRYGIVQALRQTLETAIRWRMISENPAKLAGRNPEPRREHVDPFEHSEVDRLAIELGPYGSLVVFAAETGLRPSEWIALERHDIDRTGAAVSVERTYTEGRVKTYGKTLAARRRVPLSTRAQAALDQIPPRLDTPLLFLSPTGSHIDLHNFRAREWTPALDAAGLPHRRIYDLRHTFASHALAAGVSIFELARFMGTSVRMIDRTYGHLVRGSEHAVRAKLDAYANRLGACLESRSARRAGDPPGIEVTDLVPMHLIVDGGGPGRQGTFSTGP
jgi:integrase